MKFWFKNGERECTLDIDSYRTTPSSLITQMDAFIDMAERIHKLPMNGFECGCQMRSNMLHLCEAHQSELKGFGGE